MEEFEGKCRRSKTITSLGLSSHSSSFDVKHSSTRSLITLRAKLFLAFLDWGRRTGWTFRGLRLTP